MSRPIATTLVPVVALAAALFASVTSVAAQAGKPTTALYARAKAWQDTLRGKSPAAIAGFVDPVERASPAAIDALSREAANFARADTALLASVKVDPDGRHGATEHLVARSRFAQTGGGVVRDRFAWVKRDDGRWYVDLGGDAR